MERISKLNSVGLFWLFLLTFNNKLQISERVHQESQRLCSGSLALIFVVNILIPVKLKPWVLFRLA